MNEIVSLIETKGLAITISAIAIYFSIQLINIYLDKLKTQTKEKKHDELLEIRKKINLEIEKSLEKIMLKTSSSRAFVFEYHNGLTGLGGLPFLKMSNTYEVCNEGVSSQQSNLENMSCSMFSSLLNKIEEREFVLLDTKDRCKDLTNLTYETLVEQDVDKTLIVKLVNTKKSVIGYIGLDYCNGNENFNKKHIKQLQELALEVGALLSVK